MYSASRRWQFVGFGLCVAVLLPLFGCGGSSSPDKAKSDDENSPAADARTVEIPQYSDDVSASAPPIEVEIDGKPWITSDAGILGDPRAVKGGSIKSYTPDWPETLRIYGKGSQNFTISIIESLCFESLCGIHPQSNETIPSLATHWHISDDKKVFRFKLNPAAKWSDGKPVRPEDIIATFKLLQDETLLDPVYQQITDKFETPVKIADDEIEVRSKKVDWRNFLSFSGLAILPAHEIEGLTGEQFRDKFNRSYPVNSGPYLVKDKDVKTDESITLTRRKDYWGANTDSRRYLYNFERIRFVVIRDQRVAFQKALQGSLDFHALYTAKWWVEDIVRVEAYKRGLLVKHKIFTRNPEGVQGMAFNMRKAPLDDVRLRKALAHLYDRKTLLKQFAYSQYTRSKSYFPNSDYENPGNELVEFDPKRALELLTEAGWGNRDSDGFLTKNGKRLTLRLQYRTKGFNKYLLRFQQACERAGVEITLDLVDPETHFKRLDEQDFEIAGMAWTGSLFPYPKAAWSSEMAAKKNSQNISGVSDPAIDKLIDEYDVEFDHKKRIGILRELDAKLFDLAPYSLDWYIPAQRLLFWNKFGLPKGGLGKYKDWRDVFVSWWVDPAKEAELKKLKKSGTGKMATPPAEDKFWISQTGEEAADTERPEAP